MKFFYALLICIMIFLPKGLTAGNYIRAVRLSYMAYNEGTGEYDREIPVKENYEIRAGNKKCGSIVPVAIFQNTTSDKYLQFYVAALIKNSASEQTLNYQSVVVSDVTLSAPEKTGISYVDENGNPLEYNSDDGKGLPPGGYVKVIFGEFTANPNDENCMGVLSISVFSMSKSYPDNNPFPDEDVTDDTLKASVISLKIIKDFNISNSDFGIESNGKFVFNNWLNRGAEIVDGNEYCYLQNSKHKKLFIADSTYLFQNLPTPVVRMNRPGENNRDVAPGSRGGDTLISQIFDLHTRLGTIINLFYQRTGKEAENYNRGWCDSILTGPEHLVISGHTHKTLSEPDKLILEFIYTDYDNLDRITNPPDSLWNKLPRRNGAAPVIDNPPLTIFGGGGYARGYLESDNDSALTYEQGLRFSPFDTGKDIYLNRLAMALPDTLLSGSGYVRFRLRVDAKNNSGNSVTDDEDDFYVKSFYIWHPAGFDLAPNSFKIHNPYSVIPKDADVKIPITVKIENLSNVPAPPRFYINTKIRHESEMPWSGKYDHYERYDTSLFKMELKAVQTEEIKYPSLDLGNFRDLLVQGENKFYVITYLDIPAGDFCPENDTLITEFTVNIGESFAYDGPANVVNDVAEFSGIEERGLNLPAYSSGIWNPDHAFGDAQPKGGGKIAVRFELSERDTVFGFQSYFVNLGQSPERVQYEIYRDNDGLPGENVNDFTLPCNKGYDNIRKDYFFDEYATSLYQLPVILDSGVYWVAVTQMGDAPLGLGGSAYRAGMMTTVDDETGYGINDRCVNISRGMQQPIYDTTKYYISISGRKNANYFAYTNSINGFEKWVPFTPDQGNPAYAHLDQAGTIDGIKTYSRGTFVPMLRVYMDGSHYHPDAVNDKANSDLYVNIFPNPVKGIGILELRNAAPGSCSIDLYDATGSLVKHIYGGYNDGNLFTYSFNTGGLADGVYYLKIYSGDMFITKKITILN